MTDYNKFVLAVNKIFEVINKIKANSTSPESLSQIEKIEEYKQVIINASTQFSNKKDVNNIITPQDNMEKLSSLEEEV